MKLLVDMNLSPSWVGGWRGTRSRPSTGPPSARPPRPTTKSCLGRCGHGFVVLTNDLDFSAILAATSGRTPSVVQLRAQDLLSQASMTVVARALEVHRDDIERGALLSIDEGGTRVRMLPLRTPPAES